MAKRSIFDEYMSYLAIKKIKLTKEEAASYNFLFLELAKIRFDFVHPMDENRYIDGLSVRTDFQFETGKSIFPEDGLMAECTVLEMLVALACRCENQIMRNVDVGDRTKVWFFVMLDNLGVKITNNEWKFDTSELIQEHIKVFLDRKYNPDGSNGGLFPLKKPLKNQRNEQIWNQLMAYINENFFDDDRSLVLYSVASIT